MLNISFDMLNKLDNVKESGSDLQLDPLQDESLTIFLKNGYRLITTKTLLGQTIRLDPFDDNVQSMPSFESEVYHSTNPLTDNVQVPHYRRIQGGSSTEIEAADFINKIRQVTGEPVFDFLIKRHQMLGFLTIHKSNSSSHKP